MTLPFVRSGNCSEISFHEILGFDAYFILEYCQIVTVKFLELHHFGFNVRTYD